MRYLILGLGLLIGSVTQACEPANIDADKTATSGVYWYPDMEQYRQDWRYFIKCEDDTLFSRTSVVKQYTPGDSTGVGAILAAKAEAFRVRLVQHYRVRQVDYWGKIDRATEMIVLEDINPSLDSFVQWLKMQSDPSVGQMAGQWRSTFGELTWVQTSAQADSVLYRIADSFGMSGLGLLNWMKANADWLE